MGTVTVAFMSYNQRPFVREALESVLSQSRRGFQLVVFDDGSTDGTREEVRRVLAEHDGPEDVVTVLRSENDPGTALGATLAACDGDHIVMAHGDDVSHPDRVRRMAAVLARWREQFAQPLWGSKIELTDQMRDDLNALGYTTGGEEED